MDELTNETESPKQEEVSTLRYDTVPPVRQGGKGKKILLILILLILVGAGVGGFNFIKGRQTETEEVAPTPTPAEIVETPTPTAETSPAPTSKPTATPTKKPTKNLTIKVLNGSGVTGAAKQAADYLTGLGYEIISVGNADIESLENTTIQIKSAKQTLLDQLKIDLSTKYTIGTTSADLSSTSSSDAVVTIGKN